MTRRPQADSSTAPRVTLGDVKEAAFSFWRRMPVALIGAWFGLTVLLYAFVVWQGHVIPSAADVLQGDFQITSVRQFLVVTLVAQAISLVRVGLYLPARRVYEGEQLDISKVLRMAAGRVPTLLNLTVKLTALFVLVGLICFLLDVSFTLWVIIPLAFALEPAKYYATAHRMSAGDAIRHTLRVTRRHWLPVFVVFGAITCLSAGLPALIEAATALSPTRGWSAAEYIGRVSAHIGVDFVALMASCGLYFALDDCER